MPASSWLNWLGLRLPPSPNETPKTRKKRLLSTPRTRLWPSEEENWHRAQENSRRERWEALEADRIATLEAIEKEHERGMQSLERKRRSGAIRTIGNLSENEDLTLVRIKRMIGELNASAKRKESARRKVSATRKGSQRDPAAKMLEEAMKEIARRPRVRGH
jgi:hypothetical protein